ncbi:MAG TPA: RNA helicase [Dehalococcoidia bacterium]|nr:RNA helicase [Dehalococcoidia bacterium]
MDFKQFNLSHAILAGIEGLGFVTPTPIQEQSISDITAGHDFLGLAQTGTGKTAAFMIPTLENLSKEPNKSVTGLILVPTRELAEQVFQDARALGKHTHVKTMSIYGGVGKWPQTKKLRQGVSLVIGTPGRVLDHIRDGNLILDKVQMVVLDEADTMCDMGFLPDVSTILQETPNSRQTLLFSATMAKEIRQLASKFMREPVTVQLGALNAAPSISHVMFPISSSLKKPLLLDIIKETATGKILIFTRTKHKAKQLADDLYQEGYKVTSLQGNLSQAQRQRAMEGFRLNKFDILVATDIAAHGIDVAEVTHVINYDMPHGVDDYTHRVGRTGRAQKIGEAFSLLTPEDKNVLFSIEKSLNEPIEYRTSKTFDYGVFRPETILRSSNRNDQYSDRRPAVKSFKTRRPNSQFQEHTRNNSRSSASPDKNINRYPSDKPFNSRRPNSKFQEHTRNNSRSSASPDNNSNRYPSDKTFREMIDVQCAQCGKDAQVPFKPRGDRPVFCNNCFRSSDLIDKKDNKYTSDKYTSSKRPNSKFQEHTRTGTSNSRLQRRPGENAKDSKSQDRPTNGYSSNKQSNQKSTAFRKNPKFQTSGATRSKRQRSKFNGPPR